MIIIGRQLTEQRFIFKIASERLRRANWSLELTLDEARNNDEIVSISDSQILRFIDEINGVHNTDEKAREIKSAIKRLKKQPHSIKNRNEINSLYKQLDAVQFKKDYITLVVANKKDYLRACKGFKINGIEYSRLLATNGGVKNSTIVFVNSVLIDELRKRIDNGRNLNKEMIPAKFEAYRALTCSGSTPVSMPNGILVVNDCITKFNEDVIYIDDENSQEPKMSFRPDTNIELNCSDGYGLILPSLAERWSDELGLDYISAGFNTRFSFEKGMVFCFDFIKFAKEVAKKEIVIDAWGNEVNINSVELILTTSQLKLWDSYESCEHYLKCCKENRYSFSITKTCPKELENERNLNYQFIQSYNLDDNQISELISPTINEIKDVLAGDYRKAILFLKGIGLNDENVTKLPDDFCKAIMIDKRVFNDPFIRSKIYSLIKHRIQDAKIGVIKVHGNYSILSGDPYALCQSIFNLKVTGLLKKHELYNAYWVNSNNVVCFRAPMTCHNNIKVMKSVNSPHMQEWYKYMNTVTILNSWDTTTQALNGADYDGDLIFITDNKVLLENAIQTPTIMCIQRKGVKTIPNEANLVQSNINSFGDEIGKTTNWITSMFEIASHYDKDSEENRVLDYRIKCGQLFQQNAIDKAKGIVANPMPKEWHDIFVNKVDENDDADVIRKKNFNKKIAAYNKPYFMIYIYPTLMRDYKNYIKNARAKCMREFRISLEKLIETDYQELDSTKKEFIKYFYKRTPVGIGNCVMNKICRRFEKEFDGCLSEFGKTIDFDYRILKSNVPYCESHKNKVRNLYEDYCIELKKYHARTSSQRVNAYEDANMKLELKKKFIRKCSGICSSEEELCNIILDLCYQKNSSKQFVWDICSSQIIMNLLRTNKNRLTYPKLEPSGTIEFAGRNFEMQEKEIDV